MLEPTDEQPARTAAVVNVTKAHENSRRRGCSVLDMAADD
jgi:hypothetical protein